MKGYKTMKEQRNFINKLINKLKRATTEEEKIMIPSLPTPIKTVLPDPITYRELLKEVEVVQSGHGSQNLSKTSDSLIKTYVKRLPKTGALGESQLHKKVGVVSSKTSSKVETRLGTRIAQVKLPDKSSVTMTFGLVLCANGVMTDIDTVINKADKKLYEGKKNGKDRIEYEIMKANKDKDNA